MYSEYAEDFREPVDCNFATAEEIIQCFEFLSAYIENPKILNTEIKLADLLAQRGGAYLETGRHKGILNTIERRLSQI